GGGEEWVAVLEFAPWPGDPPLRQGDVEALVEALREWHPVGLFHHERYAIQLQLTARDPQTALDFAFAGHRDAARSVAIPATTFVRAEIVRLADFESLGASGAARDLIVGPLTGRLDP
ncbi:MAG: hypothetical protein QOK39_756, partial [Acidimicrobiaceae bacterium]|nr:hypothetical protein [Acidimicrobiaceae bacterium]